MDAISPYYHDARRALWKKIDGKEPVLVCDVYIKITALLRTSSGTNWSKMVEFMDFDKNNKSVVIENQDLLENSQDAFKKLVSNGLAVNVCKKPLMDYLRYETPEKRVTLLTKCGWVESGLEYVSTNFKITDDNSDYVLQFIDSLDTKIQQKCSLADWQRNICKYCVCNDVLSFVLCVSLSGILLKFTNIGTTIFNLVGKSSIGKTTALCIAASCWGDKDVIKQWRTTSNALERTAFYHNDGVLILDELGQINNKEAENITYMLGNGRGKLRMKSDGDIKETNSWRAMILSSGEVGIADKIESVGGKIKGGHSVRCIDIDALVSRFGIYNNLYGEKDGASFSNMLKQACGMYYGIAAEEFVRRLVKGTTLYDLDNCIKYSVLQEYGDICKKYDIKNAEGQIKRVAEIFALLAVTGVLAARNGVFTHTEEQIRSSIYNMFGKWLKDRSCMEEEHDIVELLKGFLVQHEARFQKLNVLDERNVINKLGYIDKKDDRTIYYVIPSLFQKEFSMDCVGMSHKIVRRILAEKGILELCNDGRDKCLPAITKIKSRATTIVLH